MPIVRTDGTRSRTWPRSPHLLGASLLIAAASAWSLATPAPPAQAQSDAKSAGATSRAEVHALGRVEPMNGLVIVGSRPGARILEIQVGPGDSVKAGQRLAVLEGREEARAQIALAEARKAQVEHQRDVSKEKLALERSQLDTLRAAQLTTATQIADILKKKLDDSTASYKTLGAALLGRDKIEADSKYIELQVQSLKASLEKTTLEIEQNGLAKQRELEDKQLAPSNPEFQIADRQIDLAKAALAQTEVLAPRDGTILDVLARAGEVGSGPLLRMGDLGAMVVVAEVYQTDVPRLRVGDEASVKLLGKPFHGKVTRIGSIVGRNQIMNLDPRSLQDLRVVEVTISLHSTDPITKMVNLEAEVAITPTGGG
jgi:HlyD family secretion protein